MGADYLQGGQSPKERRIGVYGSIGYHYGALVNDARQCQGMVYLQARWAVDQVRLKAPSQIVTRLFLDELSSKPTPRSPY